MNRENSDGDWEPCELVVAVSNDAELKELLRDNGGGNLVKEGELQPKRVERFKDIADGATYTLIGGLNDAVRRHRTWTQVSDKVLEHEAVKAVLSDATSYGTLEEFHDYNGPPGTKCLLASDRSEKEIDGICCGGGGETPRRIKTHHDGQGEGCARRPRRA